MSSPFQSYSKIKDIIGKKTYNVQLQAEVFVHRASRRVKTKDGKFHVVNEYILMDDTGEIPFIIWDEEIPVGEMIELQGAYTSEWNHEYRLVLSKKGFWKQLDQIQEELLEFQQISDILTRNSTINVRANIVEIEEPIIEKNCIKQRILIGDESGVIVACFFDEQVETFQKQFGRISSVLTESNQLPITLINCLKKVNNSSTFLEVLSSKSISLSQPNSQSNYVNYSRNLSYFDLNE